MVKELFLLIGGILLAILIDLWFKPLTTHKIWQSILGVLCILCLLVGFGIISLSPFKNFCRKINRNIGILEERDWNSNRDQISSCTDISPTDWKRAIEEYAKKNKLKIKAKLITANTDFNWYSAILNPYGGVYPEQNLRQSTTLNKIFDYVSQGGLFINVSDVPGYWAYNRLLNRKLDATPQIYATFVNANGRLTLTSARPFELTPFMEKLGIRVLNSEKESFKNWQFKNKFNESSDQLNIKVNRVAIVEKNIESILSPQRINEKDITPLFYAYYGNGKFLLSLIWLNSEKQFQDSLVRLICRELNSKNK